MDDYTSTRTVQVLKIVFYLKILWFIIQEQRETFITLLTIILNFVSLTFIIVLIEKI